MPDEPAPVPAPPSAPVPQFAIVPIKPWYTSWVLWVGIVTVLSGGIDALIGSKVLNSQLADFAIMAKGVLDLLLRYFRANGPIA